ncbi:MAG: IS5 family transposase [Chloroflexaceae bacterium]|nr:IS5 family transposase [Chloroflexaceae bacterium]
MADLTDEQWERLAPSIPVVPRRSDGKGRPRVDNRAVLNGILWVLCSGARWKDLPERYPPYQTCHRRFQEWIDQGVFERMAQDLAAVLQEQNQIDLTECFIDGSFVEAKKGAAMSGVGKTAKARP